MPRALRGARVAAALSVPEPAMEASSLLVDLPDDRSCEAARVPAEWCLESPRECFEAELSGSSSSS